MLNIEKTIEDKRLVIALAGRLDTSTAPQLETELKDCLDGVEALTLDFETMNRQCEMKVIHVNETIGEIFEITGFTDVLTIE